MNYIEYRKYMVLVVFLLFSTSVMVTVGSSISEPEEVLSSKIWYVDDDGGADYTSIQAAIDNASDGDTVFVYSGMYYEIVHVVKEIDLIGEDKNTTIIDAQWQDTPVRIWSSNVTVEGFTVQNGIVDWYSSGINIYGAHVQVTDCIMKNNDCGFRVTNTDDVLIENCTIHDNSGHSIYNIESSNVTIQYCESYHNGCEEESVPGGIYIANDAGNDPLANVFIHHNLIYENALDGVAIVGGGSQEGPGYTDVYIESNYIFNNTGQGIIISTSEVMVRDNVISGNKDVEDPSHYDAGCYLSDCLSLVTIENNHFSSNYRGVFLMRSTGNIIQNNNFVENTKQVVFNYRYGFSNEWTGNYFDNQILPGVKILSGVRDNILYYPFLDFDWHPAENPHDIDVN